MRMCLAGKRVRHPGWAEVGARDWRMENARADGPAVPLQTGLTKNTKEPTGSGRESLLHRRGYLDLALSGNEEIIAMMLGGVRRMRPD